MSYDGTIIFAVVTFTQYVFFAIYDDLGVDGFFEDQRFSISKAPFLD